MKTPSPVATASTGAVLTHLKRSPKKVNRLTFHNRRRFPLHRLPFVSKVPNKAGCSFWNVPQTGGYTGGCRTGKALATIYLRHLRKHPAADLNHALQNIALEMLSTLSTLPNDQEAHGSLSGQAVGFFSELDRWLARAVVQRGEELEQYSDQALLKEANAGLTFDDAAYMALLKQLEEVEEALEALEPNEPH